MTDSADKYTTLPSGIRYRDEVVGEGESPRPGQWVTVH